VLLAVLGLLLPDTAVAQTAILGSGTQVHSGTEPGPVNIWYKSRRCQMVYTAAEIHQALGGNLGPLDLLGLGFWIESPPDQPLPNFQIRLGTTTATGVGSSPLNVGQVTVYTNPSYAPQPGGFQVLTFPTPFNWNGTANLLVDVCFDLVANYTSTGVVRTYAAGGNGLWSSYSDVTPQCSGTGSTNTVSYKPQIRLDFGAPVPMTITGQAALHPTTASVGTGELNADFLRMELTTYGSLEPLTLTQLTCSAQGSTALTDIANVRLLFNPSTPDITTATVLAQLPNPTAQPLTFALNQVLVPGKNYFWLRYDVADGAVENHVLDAEWVSYAVGGGSAVPVGIAPPGNRLILNPFASLPFFEPFETEWFSAEANQDKPSVHWRTLPPSSNSSWRLYNRGSTALWTNPGAGGYDPPGSDAFGARSGLSARFHSFAATAGTTADLDLFLAMPEPGTKLLNFDYHNRNGTDRLLVLFSANNGQTFDTLASYAVSQQWFRIENLVLTTAAVPRAILRFRGRANNSSLSDIGIDNIHVRVQKPVDLAVWQVVAPTGAVCGTGARPVRVVVKNLGTAPVPAYSVSVAVGGQTYTQAAVQPLAPNDTASIVVPGVMFPALTDYALDATVSVAGAGTPQHTNVSFFEPARLEQVPTIATFPYFEGFEQGRGGWTTGGALTSWAWGVPAKSQITAAPEGQKAWVTGGLGQESYNNSENSWLLSPCFDFSTLRNPILRCSTRRAFSGSSVDGVVLQASIDGGATWFRVGSVNDLAAWNWYDQNNISAQPGDQGQGWSGTDNQWRASKNQLSALAGRPSVRLRFAFRADGQGVADGFGVDAIRIEEGPIVNLGPDRFICGGQATTFDAGPGFSSYLWSYQNATTQSITVSVPDQYLVIATNAEGFTARDTVQLTVSTLAVAFGSLVQACAGEVLTLNAFNSGATYLWSTGATTPSIPATTSGTYSVTVSGVGGCTLTATTTVEYQAAPAVDLGAVPGLCTGQAQVLDAGAFADVTYLWSTGATTRKITVQVSGTYWVRVTNGLGCVGADTLTIEGQPAPVANLGPDRALCLGQSLTLAVPANAGSVLWSTGQTTPQITVAAPGAYSVQITNAFGCSAADTVVITALTPERPQLGPDRAVCGAVQLGGAPPAGVNAVIWSTGQTTPVITVARSGTYRVLWQYAADCFAADTVVLTVDEPVAAAIFARDTVLLQEPVQLVDASFPIPEAWEWQAGGQVVSTGQNPVVRFDTPGLQTLTLTVGKGTCTATATRQVLVLDSLFTTREPTAGTALVGLTAYPNPTTDRLTLAWPESAALTARDLQLNVHTLDGRTLPLPPMLDGGHRCVLDFSTYPPAIYVVVASVNGQKQYLRVVKR
jgi:PKD repeat protein